MKRWPSDRIVAAAAGSCGGRSLWRRQQGSGDGRVLWRRQQDSGSGRVLWRGSSSGSGRVCGGGSRLAAAAEFCGVFVARQQQEASDGRIL
jgi:hypothetical protein